MPLYDFENTKTGEVREFMVPHGTDHLRRKDGCWKRLTVSRLGIVAGLKPLPTQRDEVLAGYRNESDRLGTRYRSRFTTRQIKEAWATP